jgi:hypothetical protein
LSLRDKDCDKIVIEHIIIIRFYGINGINGRLFPDAPRTDPYEKNYFIRLLPWVTDAKPLMRIGLLDFG